MPYPYTNRLFCPFFNFGFFEAGGDGSVSTSMGSVAVVLSTSRARLACDSNDEGDWRNVAADWDGVDADGVFGGGVAAWLVEC